MAARVLRKGVLWVATLLTKLAHLFFPPLSPRSNIMKASDGTFLRVGGRGAAGMFSAALAGWPHTDLSCAPVGRASRRRAGTWRPSSPRSSTRR